MSLTPEQLERRRTIITASDLAAVCGVNPWRSPIEVYAEKIGEAAPFAGSWRTERGNIMEAALLRYLGSRLTAEPTPLHVVPAGEETFVHPILTWFGATSDGIAIDAATGAHVATCEAKFSAMAPDHWRDDRGVLAVPEYYAVQVQGQMTARSLKRGFVVADLAGEEPNIFQLEHDPELEAAILEVADRFMNHHVAKRIPPPIDETNRREVFARYSRSREAYYLTADAKAEALALAIADARRRLREAKDELKKLEPQMCALIGDAEGVRSSDWRATWKWSDPVDVKAHTRPGGRRFDFRLRNQREEEE